MAKTIEERDEKGRITKTTGRRPRFDPGSEFPIITKTVCDFIRAGNYLTTAAKAAGLTESQFWYYFKAGKNGNPRYKAFYEAVVKAEAEAEVVAVAMVRKAMPDNWVAAMTYLERKHPDRWGRRETVHVEGEVGHNVKQAPVVNIHVSKEAKALVEKHKNAEIIDAEFAVVDKQK